MTAATDLPDKLYFKIGEVARFVGVKPYVLRYWEAEFAGLVRPGKTESRHRLYRRKDVETLRAIKRLLHEERYTIEGARRRLRQTLAGGAAARTAASREVGAVPGDATPAREVVPPPMPQPGAQVGQGASTAPGTTAAAGPRGGEPLPVAGDVGAILAYVRRELRAVCDSLARDPGQPAPLEIR